MNTVTMIIWKDLMQQKRRLGICSAILLLVTALQSLLGSSAGMVAGLFAGLGVMMTMGSLYDEERGGLLFLRTLPMRSGWVVLGKFLAALVYLGLFTAVLGLAILLLFWLQVQVDIGALVAELLSAGAVTLLFVGVMQLIFFRYGYQAIRGIFLGFILVGITLQFIGTLLFRNNSNPPPAWLENALESIGGWVEAAPALAGCVFLAGALLLYAVTGCVAARCLRKRDL